MTDGFDKGLWAWYSMYSFVFGMVFLRKGLYLPLVPLLLSPIMTGASQL